MDTVHNSRAILVLFLMVNFVTLVQTNQIFSSNVCFLTFANLPVVANPSYQNSSVLICPSSCYTTRYLMNQQEYPLFGNIIYSANSMVCKAALHDGRVAPRRGEDSTVLIENTFVPTSTFMGTLRNDVLSIKSTTTTSFGYIFANNRIIDQPSSIKRRSTNDIASMEPIELDIGWKRWTQNQLNYFTFPWNMRRDQAVSFCTNNGGTLMYWSNSTEQQILQTALLMTIYRLFHYQQRQNNDNKLSFFIGLKQINRNRQWESNPINAREFPNININTMNPTEDYCTSVEVINTHFQSVVFYSHRCNDNVIRYPLCRLFPSVKNENKNLIYRLETDNRTGNLRDVIDFCGVLGGYPIYANNAYEWQLIQEIMLLDPSFNDNYAYTGLISPTKTVNEAYWMPMNVSYFSSMNYVWFGPSRGSDRIGYHLSKSNSESYYALYDINPYSAFNRLRFCRKPALYTTSMSTRKYSSTLFIIFTILFHFRR